MWWSCWMGSKSCPRLPFSVSWMICLKEAECSTEGHDVAFPSERCAALQKFCTPCKSEHCPETLTTGEVSLLHFPPKLYLKTQGRWVEICKMRLCSSSLTCAHQRPFSACYERAEKDGVNFRGCFTPRHGPRAAPSGSSSLQLPQMLFDVKCPTLTAHTLLPSRPAIFSSVANLPWQRLWCSLSTYRQLPEDMLMASNLSAFTGHVRMI